MSRWNGCVLCVALALLGQCVGDVLSAEHKLNGENTKIEFEGTKKDGKHTGHFPKLTGIFELGEDATKGKIEVKIEMDALTSDNEMLTGHLKSVDFFETKKFPEAKFVSKSIQAHKDGYEVKGELTMHGKTKEIAFHAHIGKKEGFTTLTSNFAIKRSEWGINYKPADIEDSVKLKIDLKVK